MNRERYICEFFIFSLTLRGIIRFCILISGRYLSNRIIMEITTFLQFITAVYYLLFKIAHVTSVSMVSCLTLIIINLCLHRIVTRSNFTYKVTLYKKDNEFII